jgi:penicillin-binding protein 1A
VPRLLRLLALLVVSAVFVTGAVVALTPAAGMLRDVGVGEPEPLFLSPLDQRTQIFDAAGNLLTALYGEQNREPVALEQIPMQVQDAVLAVEDENFYAHDGVNLRATIRALFANVSSGDVEQGGSTITQQLVKISVLNDDEQTLSRKSREAVLAFRLERMLDKHDILERYLNTVYFGNGAYGVQAAAETYWGVDVGQLDWGQAALLASLIRNPNGYNPVRFPERAAERRRIALDRLVATGHLTRAEADLYAFTPLPTEVRRATPPPDSYFVEHVKQLLLDDPSFNIGATAAERNQAVFSGGLRVFTTFDPGMQAAALQARNDVLPGDLDGQFVIPTPGDDAQGSAVVVSVDAHTGAVRTLVGGPGFDAYRYDIATQGIGRQAGSSFKVFVLAAALESGIVPSDTVSGSGPCRFPNPGGIPDPYIADNFGNSRGGSGTVQAQTLRSSNCAYLRLGQIVGLDRVIDVARRMGISTPLQPALSLPIGAFEVLPVEMAAAYASLANDGIYNPPYYIERIESVDGTVLYEHAPDPRRAVSRQTARLATQVLAANVASGTGTRARIAAQPAAGKTDTAQDSADAWFVGYTPQLATAVWMGATSGRVAMRNIGGIAVTGGSYPATIWSRYMQAVLAGTERQAFAEPGPTRRARSLRLPNERATSRSTSRSGSGSTRRTTTTTGGGGTATTSAPTTEAPPTTVAPPPTAPPTTAPPP